MQIYKKIFLTILATILFSACSPRYITKVEKQTDTLYQVRHLRDSVYIRDSVSTSIFTSGDTVYYNRYKSIIRYKEKLKVDTVKQIKEILNTDTKVVEVKKKHGKFSIFIIGLLSGSLLLLILEKICFYKKL